MGGLQVVEQVVERGQFGGAVHWPGLPTGQCIQDMWFGLIEALPLVHVHDDLPGLFDYVGVLGPDQGLIVALFFPYSHIVLIILIIEASLGQAAQHNYSQPPLKGKTVANPSQLGLGPIQIDKNSKLGKIIRLNWFPMHQNIQKTWFHALDTDSKLKVQVGWSKRMLFGIVLSVRVDIFIWLTVRRWRICWLLQ